MKGRVRMKALESLYYGGIKLPDYDIPGEKEVQELLDLVARNQKNLTATLTDTQKETFDKFNVCTDELHSITEVKAFTDGFALAAKIMTEVMAMFPTN